jgi:putative ABC transport system permease protein
VFRLALRSALGHKLRLLMTALAIIAGVAFVSGTYVLSDSITAAFDDLFGRITSGSDVTVRAASGFTDAQSFAERRRVPDDLIAVIEAVPGVEAAAGYVDGFAQIVDKEGEAISPVGPPTLGATWVANEDLNTATLRTGRGPQGPGEVAIDAGTAQEYGFTIGDPVEILFATQPSETFTLVGTFGFGELDNLLGATAAAFELETAQRVLDAPGEVSAIDVRAMSGVSQSELAADIEAVLPDGFEAVSQGTLADEQAQAVSEGLGFLTTGLLVFAGVAVFVAAFIIYNTFSIIVAQRVRELAMLRAIGATASQVTGMVIIEALFVGLVGSLLGIAAGVLLAALLKASMAGLGFELPSAGLPIALRTIVVSIAVGMIVTALSAILPARKAAKVAPVEAMRVGLTSEEPPARRRIVVGGLVTLAGLGALTLGLTDTVSAELPFVGAGALLIFLGVAALSPLAARPIARAFGAPLPRLYGVTGTLAQENSMRNPYRTATTAAALMIGLALVAFFFIFGNSLKATAGVVIEESLSADYIIDSTTFQGFSDAVADDLEALPEIDVATGLKFGQFRLGGTNQTLFGVDPAEIEQVANLDVVSGRMADLAGGGMALHEDQAADWNAPVGGEIEVEFAADGVRRLPVVAVYAGDTALTGSFVISTETYEQHFVNRLDSVALATIAPGVEPEAARVAVDRVAAAHPNVEVRDQAEFKQQQIDQVNSLLSLITALLALALVIALLGITNTLALSIFERTREIGLLRAVGMSRRQVRRMVRWEAVIVSLFGALLGLTIGTFFGWAVVQASASIGITEFALPVGTLVIIFVLAGLAGIVAAVLPARRAARLNVLQAIQYE